VEKEDKQRGTYKSCINPECDYLHTREVANGDAGETADPGSLAVAPGARRGTSEVPEAEDDQSA
jgi:hypothetical protein